MSGGLALQTEALIEAMAAAVAEAERGGTRRLASATIAVEAAGVDPAALAFRSRRADDRWFCWEHPDREGFALGAVGSAHEVISRGADRFLEVSRECAAILRDRVAVEPEGMPAGAGPIWMGGFAFAPEGGHEAHWSSLPPALMVLPEVAIQRRGERAFLTLCEPVAPGRAGEALDRARSRLGSLGDGGLPLHDPHPTGDTRIEGRHPPERYERLVAEAVELIRAGGIQKVVLAREVTVEARAAHQPAALFGALRQLFPACFCFCCGTPEAAFLGASPELLVRRSGATAATVALAGSTGRSADRAVDDHLGEAMLRSAKVREEHEIVARRIERALAPHSVWVDAEAEPSVARVANVQHLATAIRAQLAEARSAIELADLLHPTPAVGGEPTAAAVELIERLEGFDRGWYAGPVGWMDAVEDGEFCVALRSTLLRDRVAHLFVGAGIVADSDPAAELAETEIKLEALLPLLAH